MTVKGLAKSTEILPLIEYHASCVTYVGVQGLAKSTVTFVLVYLNIVRPLRRVASLYEDSLRALKYLS